MIRSEGRQTRAPQTKMFIATTMGPWCLFVAIGVDLAERGSVLGGFVEELLS